MNKKSLTAIIVVLVAVILAIVLYVVFSKDVEAPTENNTTQNITTNTASNTESNIVANKTPETQEAIMPVVPEEFTQQTFENIKTPHFVSSDPENNKLFTTAVNQVSIAFDFNLGEGSEISVKHGEQEVTPEDARVESVRTLTVPVAANETGNYAVTYKACWPDASCHDGSFGFSVKLPEEE